MEAKYQLVAEYLESLVDQEDQLLSFFDSYQQTMADPSSFGKLSGQLSQFLAGHFLHLQEDSFAVQLNQFADIRQSLQQYAERVVEEQLPERFHPLPGDPIAIRLKKAMKRMGLKTGWFCLSVSNIFRKDKRAKRYWNHTIPEVALAEYVFLIRFLEKLFPVYRQLQQNREECLRLLYRADTQLEECRLLLAGPEEPGLPTEQLRGQIGEDRAALAAFFGEVEADMTELFANLREKAGTVEFPNRQLARKQLDKAYRRELAPFEKMTRHKQYVFFALAEHWRLKLRNRKLIFGLQFGMAESSRNVEQEIHTQLEPAFRELHEGLQSFAAKLSAPDERIKKDAYELKDWVEARVSALINRLVQSPMGALFDQPLLALGQDISLTGNDCRFAVAVFRNKKLKDSSFRQVKTRQLLDEAIFQVLKQQFVPAQKELAVRLQHLSANLSEIQHALEYTIEYYFEQEDREAKSHELAEGLKRAIRRSEESLRQLVDLPIYVRDVFGKVQADFTRRTLKYFDPAWLHRSEIVNRRKGYVRRVRQSVLQSWRQWQLYVGKSISWMKGLYVFSSDKYFNLKNLLGIVQEKEPISTELSNYLSETRQAIGRLPLMYQKLFENSPLTEDRFYMPRQAEIDQLQKAFQSWKQGNFAPTCLVGEQGSGITTVFNFFSGQVDQQVAVNHFYIRDNRYTEADFLDFFREMLPDLVIPDFDSLVQQINNMPEPRVVILEHIHNLFLRKNGAFGNLYLLFRLMSQTNRKIFWLCSSYLYSWKLLDFTLHIAGYFAHVVTFEKNQVDMLREAIMKRHRVSGYNLTFLEPENFSPKRSYARMNEEGKQNYLREIFFGDLWEHAQGNMYLAFIYWLRAIVRVNDDRLFIRQKHLSFNFLNTLKADEITTLHGILVHGGLTIKEHAEVFHQPEPESARQLMVLHDDGLIELQRDKYVINPLLYRTLVSRLKSLNFIY